MGKVLLSFLFIAQSAWATLPSPADTAHPGNETSVLNFERSEIQELGRTSVLYLPKRAEGERAPLVVFGHGQALNEQHYDKTLEHLAKKGVAVLFVQFDNGFFDQDWRRMASDWNQITDKVIQIHSSKIDQNAIVYSGHSKGGYVGLMAAGAPNRPNVVAGVFFAPAGYDNQYLQNLEPSTTITLVWGEQDTIIDKSAVMEIFNKMNQPYKQFIEVKSYKNQKADHYFPQNKSTFFGGVNGVTGFHHHGVWQWLVAAAWDAEQGNPITQPYLYGDKAGVSGEDGLEHSVTRSWQPRYEFLYKLKPNSGGAKTLSIAGLASYVGHSWYKSVLSKSQRQAIERTGEVEFINRNIELKMLLEPDDLDARQWAFKNPKGFDISAPLAWDFSVGKEDIVVAVIDSGIQWSHRELKDNIWENPLEAKGQKGVDDDNNGYVDDIKGFHFLLNNPESNDTRGHGTMVSGMIGAKGNNGYGIAGVAWNVKLMPLNMFPNLWGNATLEAAVKAIHYAVDNKANVINASFGQADDDFEPDEGFEIFVEAIERAEQSGIVVVAAAGNSSGDNDKKGMIPATLPLDNIVAVGAMNSDGNKWAKTNYGQNNVHVMAPGEEIFTTHPNGARSVSGTSLSAPIVTGIVVLMLDVNPQLSPLEIRKILVSSCEPHPPLASLSQCGGFINAHLAVSQAAQMVKNSQ